MRRPLAVLGWAERAAALLNTVLLLALGVSSSTHAGQLWRDEVSTLQLQAPDGVNAALAPVCRARRGALKSGYRVWVVGGGRLSYPGDSSCRPFVVPHSAAARRPHP